MYSVKVLSMKVSLVVLVLVTITGKVSSKNIISDKLSLEIESPPLAQPDTVRQKRQYGSLFGGYGFQRVGGPYYSQGQGYQNNIPGYQGYQNGYQGTQFGGRPNVFNGFSNIYRGFGNGYQNYGRG